MPDTVFTGKVPRTWEVSSRVLAFSYSVVFSFSNTYVFLRGIDFKMMSELRFQCYEVEKMQTAHRGLIESNTLLLAQAASARHGVEVSARRSHLLQRIIRYMHQKVELDVFLLQQMCPMDRNLRR